VGSDSLVLTSGGTVFHAGLPSNGPLSTPRRTVSLTDAPHQLPSTGQPATVAAAMLDEAETPRFTGTTALPLDRCARLPAEEA
jgi:hypothetical protein